MKILTAKERKPHPVGVMSIVPLSELQPTIRAAWYPEDYVAIKEDIIAHGLRHPLVVWHTTISDWLEWSLASPDIIGPTLQQNKNPTKQVYLVMCGNNRLRIAKELGYDYTDVIMFENRRDVSQLCSKQRKQWKKRLQKQNTSPQVQQLQSSP